MGIEVYLNEDLLRDLLKKKYRGGWIVPDEPNTALTCRLFRLPPEVRQDTFIRRIGTATTRQLTNMGWLIVRRTPDRYLFILHREDEHVYEPSDSGHLTAATQAGLLPTDGFTELTLEDVKAFTTMKLA